jgi:CBS domain
MSVPIASCVALSLGPIREDILEQLEKAGYDQAPVLGAAGEVIGIVDTVRLRKLVAEDRILATDGEMLSHTVISATTSLDELLDALAVSRGALVVDDNRRATVGFVTISDLNRHSVRRTVYGVLAELEDRLARGIERHFSDSWQWLRRLGEDHQIRLLGYAELTRKRGVDVDPINACTLTQLLSVVGAFSELRARLGFESRSKWDCLVGPVIDLRNKVMHPVRPMVLGHEDVKQLHRAISSLVEIHSRVRALGPLDSLNEHRS